MDNKNKSNDIAEIAIILISLIGMLAILSQFMTFGKHDKAHESSSKISVKQKN